MSQKSPQVVKHVVKGEKWACSPLEAGKNKPVMFTKKTRDFKRICEEIKENRRFVMNLQFWSDVTPSAMPIRLELSYPHNPQTELFSGHWIFFCPFLSASCLRMHQSCLRSQASLGKSPQKFQNLLHFLRKHVRINRELYRDTVSYGKGVISVPENISLTRGEQVKSKVLLAAAKLFLEKGYTESRMREISTLAGVNYGSMMFIFRSKEEILAELVGFVLEGQFESTRKLLQGKTDDKILFYAAETTLQLYLAESSEHMR